LGVGWFWAALDMVSVDVGLPKNNPLFFTPLEIPPCAPLDVKYLSG